MRRSTHRIVLGLALAGVLTALLAGSIATAAAITIERTDGDTCETGGTTYVRPTPTPENAKTIAGNVTGCIVDGPETGVAPKRPPPGGR